MHSSSSLSQPVLSNKELTDKLKDLLPTLSKQNIEQAMALVRAGAEPNLLLNGLINHYISYRAIAINEKITFDEVKPLLEELVKTYHADINCLDSDLIHTNLHLSPLQRNVGSVRADLDMIILLLELGANPAVIVSTWNTSLHTFFEYLLGIEPNEKSDKALRLVINHKDIAYEIEKLFHLYKHKDEEVFFKYLIRMFTVGLKPTAVSKQSLLSIIESLLLKLTRQDPRIKYLLMVRDPKLAIGKILFPPARTVSEFVSNKNMMQKLQQTINPFVTLICQKKSIPEIVNDFFGSHLFLNESKNFKWDDVLVAITNGDDVNATGNITSAAKEKSRLKTHRATIAHMVFYCIKNNIRLPEYLLKNLFAFGLDLSVLSSEEREVVSVSKLFTLGDYHNALALVRYGENSYVQVSPGRWFDRKITFLDAMLDKFSTWEVTEENARFIVKILECGVSITVNDKDYPHVFIALVNCLDALPDNFALSKNVLLILKKFKDQYSAAMEKIFGKEYAMLYKVFKVRTCPLSQVYFAGTPNAADANSRLGKAHIRYHELEHLQEKNQDQTKLDSFIAAIRKDKLNNQDRDVIDKFFAKYAHNSQVFNQFSSGGGVALIAACYGGQVELVERLLAIPGINVNVRIKNKITALMVATNKKAWEIVNKLLAAGADPTLVDNDDLTPVHSAATISLQAIECFIKFDSNLINVTNRLDSTPLLFAIRFSKLDVVRYLLKVNADVNKGRMLDVNLALRVAMDVSCFGAIVHLLFAAKAEAIDEDFLIKCKPNKKKLSEYIKTLPESEQLNMYREVFDGKQATAIGKFFWYIHSNVKTGNLNEMFLHYHALLKEKLKLINVDNLSAEDIKNISYFIRNRVQLVGLVKFAEVDADIEHILRKYRDAAPRNPFEPEEISYMAHFPKKVASVRDDLIEAIKRKDLERVQEFMQDNKAPNDTEIFNELNKGLITACSGGFLDIVCTLLADPRVDVNYDAYPNTMDNLTYILSKINGYPGDTALIVAARGGHIEVVQKLLQIKNIDIHAKNGRGATALALALSKGHYDVAQQLLSASAEQHFDGEALLQYFIMHQAEIDGKIFRQVLDDMRDGNTSLGRICVGMQDEKAKEFITKINSIFKSNQSEVTDQLLKLIGEYYQKSKEPVSSGNTIVPFDIEKALQLIRQGANPNVVYASPASTMFNRQECRLKDVFRSTIDTPYQFTLPQLEELLKFGFDFSKAKRDLFVLKPGMYRYVTLIMHYGCKPKVAMPNGYENMSIIDCALKDANFVKPEDVNLIFVLLNYGEKISKHANKDVFSSLLNWLRVVKEDQLTAEHLVHLKSFVSQLLDVVESWDDEEQLKLLEQVFIRKSGSFRKVIFADTPSMLADNPSRAYRMFHAVKDKRAKDSGKTSLNEFLSAMKQESLEASSVEIINKFLEENKHNRHAFEEPGVDLSIALIVGVQFDHFDLVTTLLAINGMGINIPNHLGDTPLITAVKYNRFIMVKLLLDKGADTSICNLENNTAFYYAMMGNGSYRFEQRQNSESLFYLLLASPAIAFTSKAEDCKKSIDLWGNYSFYEYLTRLPKEEILKTLSRAFDKNKTYAIAELLSQDERFRKKLLTAFLKNLMLNEANPFDIKLADELINRGASLKTTATRFRSYQSLTLLDCVLPKLDVNNKLHIEFVGRLLSQGIKIHTKYTEQICIALLNWLDKVSAEGLSLPAIEYLKSLEGELRQVALNASSSDAFTKLANGLAKLNQEKSETVTVSLAKPDSDTEDSVFAVDHALFNIL